jgi:hypothetical protein
MIVGWGTPASSQTLLDAVDDVGGVLVDGVVDAAGPGGLGAVVIDAQPPPMSMHVEARAHLLELGVDVGEFVDGVLETADVVDLAPTWQWISAGSRACRAA